MKSGYNVFWTAHALAELNDTIIYLEKNFTIIEIKRLVEKIESTVTSIAQNPYLYQWSEKKKIFKVVLLRYNNLYFHIIGDKIEIISFFSNRQSSNRSLV